MDQEPTQKMPLYEQIPHLNQALEEIRSLQDKPDKTEDEEGFQDFLENRKIKEEDLCMVAAICLQPKRLLITDFHNFFNLNKDDSSRQLQNQIKLQQARLANLSANEAKEAQNKLNCYQVFADFNQKYDWSVSWNLARQAVKFNLNHLNRQQTD